MLKTFNANMYTALHSKDDLAPSTSYGISDTDVEETFELITMFDPDETCVVTF